MFNVKVNKLNIQFTFAHYRGIGEANGVSDVTQCTVKVNGQEFHAVAACSEKDAFVKSIGRKVALARALKEVRKKIELSPLERRAVWERYFDRRISNMTWAMVHPNEPGKIMANGVLDQEYVGAK